MPKVPGWVKISFAVLLLVSGADAGVVAGIRWRYGVTIHNATDSPLLVKGLKVQWQVLPPDGEAYGWQLPMEDRIAGGLESPAIVRAWAAGSLDPDAEIVFCQDGYSSEVLDQQGRRIELVRGHVDLHGWSCPRPKDVWTFPRSQSSEYDVATRSSR